MGFETSDRYGAYREGNQFETSLWDLKREIDRNGGNRCKVRNLPMGFETQLAEVTESFVKVRNLPMGFETHAYCSRCLRAFGSKPPYGI